MVAVRVFFLEYLALSRHLRYSFKDYTRQNSSGVEQLTRNEQVKGSNPFFG